MKPHKWHKEIKAWADDDQCIEVCKAGIWYSTDYPNWNDEECSFRIKPQPKEPQYLYVYGRDGEIGYMYSEPRGWAEDLLGKIKLEADNE